MKRAMLWGCGGVSLLMAFFHLAFWKLFGWSDELPHLSGINQGILQVLNLAVVYLLLFGTVATFVVAGRKRIDSGEKMLLGLYAGFYLWRGILEGPFFGWDVQGLIVILVCLAMAVGYGWNCLDHVAPGREPQLSC